MEYRQLGASGLKVPVLSLGTATFGGGTEFFRKWGATEVAEASRMVDICLEAGANLFDTADVYSAGLAEEILGQAVKGRRDRLLISTKASFPMGGGPNDIGSSRHHLIAAVEASLRRLGTDHIDLFQLHGFDATTPVEEVLRTLDDLVTAGKLRYIGCSNFSGWHLMKSLAVAERYGWPRHVAHQAYYSLLGREFEWELMPLALDQKVGTVVWSPLAGGFLSGKYHRDGTGPSDGRRASFDFPPVDQERGWNVIDVMREIAAAHDVSVARIALSWLLHQKHVTSVIIGAKTSDQLLDNIAAAELRLSSDELSKLNAVSALPSEYPGWMIERQAEYKKDQAD